MAQVGSRLKQIQKTEFCLLDWAQVGGFNRFAHSARPHRVGGGRGSSLGGVQVAGSPETCSHTGLARGEHAWAKPCAVPLCRARGTGTLGCPAWTSAVVSFAPSLARRRARPPSVTKGAGAGCVILRICRANAPIRRPWLWGPAPTARGGRADHPRGLRLNPCGCADFLRAG